jgi:tRNA threonylcarbamoyladenosine biosynthesis protein TsaB
MRVLAIDTATEHCSAALWDDGALSDATAPVVRGNGELILGLVGELLRAARLRLEDVDALAFGRGPGAFTGVRLAASTVQGLAFACARPVIPVSNLAALAQQLFELPEAPARALICQDARMHEAYWAAFEKRAGVAVSATAERVASPADLVAAAGAWFNRDVWGAGSAFDAYPELASAGLTLGRVLPALAPRAREIARLAVAAGTAAAVPAEQALPVYVRNQVAQAPSRS